MFSQDNKIVMIANKVTELIILSCIWRAACIPLITTGAACASAYNAVIKAVRRDTGYIWREFPTAMWENLKGMWLLTLGLYAAAGAFVAIAVRLWPVRDSFFGGVYFFMSCFLALTVILYAVHLFCLCGRFPLPRKALCKVALWMTFSRPLNNLLLAFVILGSIWMTLTVWQLIFILPGLFFWFLTHLEEPAFHRFINYEDDLNPSETEE